MRVYATDFPVLPTCFIFPSFSKADKYLVAVASETCRSFSTSSLVACGEPACPALARGEPVESSESVESTAAMDLFYLVPP